MTPEQFHEFIEEQIKEMENYKWIQSQKVGYDLGNACYMKWILLYAKNFREKWLKKHNIKE